MRSNKARAGRNVQGGMKTASKPERRSANCGAPIFIVEKAADMRYNKLLNFSGVAADYGELVLDGEAVFYEGRHYWLFPRDSKR